VYLRPASLKEALDALASHGGRLIAGGTDVFPALEGPRCEGVVVDLSRVADLRGIAQDGRHVRIGARTTFTDILNADLPPCFDALKAAAREVGSVQVQNVGTIGGNLCNASPAADGVPPLLVLDAAVELASVRGCRVLPLSDFLTGYRSTARCPDEVLAAVLVPRTIETGASAFLKLGARRYLVISIVMAAAVVEVDADGRVAQARVAVGACSAVAQRLRALEEDLVGVRAGPDLGALARPAHLFGLTPIDDVRASAAYRREAALTLVRRALALCVAEP
jgi:CO/xanthine dehydrogenase FAD-binding subunit